MPEPKLSSHLTAQTPLSSAIASWQAYLADKGRSPNTIKAFLSDVRLLATYLPEDIAVGKIVPFREAHAITGRIVRWALDAGRELSELSVKELFVSSPRFEKSVLERLTVQGAIDRKTQIGGTAKLQVVRRLKERAKLLA